MSVNEFIDLAWDAFKQGIVGALASVAVLVVLSVLGGMSDALTAGFKRKETKQVVYFAIYAGIVASLAGIVVSLSGSVTDASVAVSSSGQRMAAVRRRFSGRAQKIKAATIPK